MAICVRTAKPGYFTILSSSTVSLAQIVEFLSPQVRNLGNGKEMVNLFSEEHGLELRLTLLIIYTLT